MPSTSCRSKLLTIVKVITLSCIPYIFTTHVCGSVVGDVATAHQLVDAAITNARRLPSYVTVSTEDFSRGTSRKTKWVYNSKDGVQYIKYEAVLQLPNGKTETAVFIQNGDGLRRLYDNGIINVRFPLLLERPIPRWLGTAQKICFENKITFDEAKHLVCSIEEDSDFFGMPCRRISISITPDLIALLGRKTEATAPIDPQLPAGPPTEPPTTYVYFITKENPFIVSWQSFDRTGKKVNEISLRDFHVESSLPSTLFEVPVRAKNFTARNKNEYDAAVNALVSARPEKGKKGP